MSASEKLLSRDRVTTSGESPMRVLEEPPNSPSTHPRDLSQSRRAPRTNRSSSFVRKSNLEFDSDEDSSEDDDMIDWRPNDYRDSEFDDEDEGPSRPRFVDYDSSRRDEGRPSLAYRPHPSKVPSGHASHDPTIRLPRPLPRSIPRIKQKQRKRTFNDRPLSPSNDFHFNDPRYPRMNQEYEVATYYDYPSHPDRYGPVRRRHQRLPVSEWLLPRDDPNNIRQSEGIYDSGIVAGKRYADVRKANSLLPPIVYGSRLHASENELDIQYRPPYVPMQSAGSYSRRRPTTVDPFMDYHTNPSPDYAARNVPKYRSRGFEVDSDESSNENEEAWADLKYIGSEGLLESPGFVEPSCQMEFRSNVQADEDILNPLSWNRKLFVTENAIKANHFNRRSWPDNWRHSDFNASPKVLIDVWGEFLEVNNLVTQFGLDTALPSVDNTAYRSKRQCTLAEVVNACKAWLMQEAKDIISIPPPSTSSLPRDSWDTTCEQFQRLLMARDYLIAVCKDAEYLNELHPTMDAITWFEKAQFVDHRGRKTARSKVIELMAVKISHLAEILKSLNLILQALLWGWGNQSTICIQSDQETAKNELQDDLSPHSKEYKLERARQRIFASTHYDNGEKRIQTCLHNLDLGLASLIDEVEVFAAILSQALFYQCDVLISDDEPVIMRYGWQEFPGLKFVPWRLQCMGDLIQNRSVWVLEQLATPQAKYPYVAPPSVGLHRFPPLTDPSYIRTTIIDLARIWGPIWKASEAQGESPWIWYQLPGGYIGCSENQKLEVTAETDEAPCHFSTVLDGSFRKGPSADFFLPTLPYLLIGHGLPGALVVRKSCQTTLETGLDGMALQSVGTLKPYRYKDSTSFHIAVGHAGTQAGWTTQVKTNPGIFMKTRILDRWKLEPRFRNPRLLLLCYGVEVSICTRNARRCRLVDVIRSRSMVQYLSVTYHPEVDSETYKTALFDALHDDNSNAFIKLYDNHPEWQEELGAMVAHCLQVLEGTGVNGKGEFGVFVFVNKFHDPEQLAILSKNDHTWIPLLKDSFHSAAFAVVSHACLEYPKAPGQTCRLKDHGRQGLKSVLQTSYTPLRRADMRKLFESMQVRHKLRMADLSKFKIKRQCPRGTILGTWHGGSLRHLHLPRRFEELFRERGQDGENGFTVFVVSERRCRLVRLREVPVVVPVVSVPIPAPDPIHSAHEELNKGFDEPTQRAGSPSPSDSSSTRGTNFRSRKKSRSSMKDDAERSHGGSQPKFTHITPEVLVTAGIPRKNNLSSVDKGTQTNQPIRDPISATAPSSSISGEFLSSVPFTDNINSSSSRQIHDSEVDADKESRRRSNRHSLQQSHSDSRQSRGHRKRRSHGERTNNESSKRNENQGHKWGFF